MQIIVVSQVYRLSEILSEQRAATKENVERKQARTELERQESDEEQSDDDGNQVHLIYFYFMQWGYESLECRTLNWVVDSNLNLNFKF